ncbi:hypothetical protein GCM10023238_16210 [Streptomyces heliomycini]
MHGSAPDIAGQGKADPSATVCPSPPLRHLGHDAEAARIEDAVSADLAERGALPARSTSQIGDALAARVAGDRRPSKTFEAPGRIRTGGFPVPAGCHHRPPGRIHPVSSAAASGR